MKTTQIVYAVPYIEVEFGERDEGYSIYLDKEKCIKETQESSANGPYEGGGGYYGPTRPLHYYEIPFSTLEPELKKTLKKNGKTHTDNHWQPRFKSRSFSIEDNPILAKPKNNIKTKLSSYDNGGWKTYSPSHIDYSDGKWH